MAVLSIDQGTTSTKAFLLHADGRFDPVGQIAHQQIHPGPGLVEHDASELIAAIEALIDQAIAAGARIDGLALANQGETVIAWDRESGAPLHRAIVWQDQRTQALLDAFDDTERTIVQERAGLPLDAYFSASKIAWLLEQPEVAAAREAGRLGIGTSDSFFIHRLTGAYATDATTASRTSLLNLARAEWDDVLCGLFRVPRGLLPEIRATNGGFGLIRRGGQSFPLLVSIVDQQAALYGHGCRAPGEAKITFGTGSFALAITGDAPALDRDGLAPTIAWRLGEDAPIYALDAGDYTAAAALDWAVRAGIASETADFALDPHAASALQQGLIFLPSLAGLAAPHWDRDAPAFFMGMGQATSREDMRRAVLEGVALRAVELLDALGVDPSLPVSIDGGLSRNACFAQFLADALGRPVRRQAEADLTALGAAELGYRALGKPEPPRAAGAAAVTVPPGGRSAAIRSRLPLFDAAVQQARQWAALRKSLTA